MPRRNLGCFSIGTVLAVFHLCARLCTGCTRAFLCIYFIFMGGKFAVFLWRCARLQCIACGTVVTDVGFFCTGCGNIALFINMRCFLNRFCFDGFPICIFASCVCSVAVCMPRAATAFAGEGLFAVCCTAYRGCDGSVFTPLMAKRLAVWYRFWLRIWLRFLAELLFLSFDNCGPAHQSFLF